ncbi:hypothetical protein NDU88_006845 [Pleurodeles waltl]|uniref:Uncharacterized protein n=1 Tax=Pleurodeles waltl TaxID=8319 RepID=A0AAV7NUB7_PLEWA|nr:hypothetical protein NDU88_006845 [Pleurodeles waltl]
MALGATSLIADYQLMRGLAMPEDRTISGLPAPPGQSRSPLRLPTVSITRSARAAVERLATPSPSGF